MKNQSLLQNMSSCAVVCPLNDPELFFSIHSTLTATESNLTQGLLTSIQADIDLMKQLLTDATDILFLSSFFSSNVRREKVMVWEMVEHGQAMSLLGSELLSGDWMEVAKEGSRRVVQMLNTKSEGGGGYGLKRLQRVY